MADVRALGDGRFLVTTDGVQRIAYAVAGNGATWVFLDGHSYLVGGKPAAQRRDRSASQDDDLALAAPMPATVTAVHVKAGQSVARGDLLVMLEAMKMELPVKAPRDGRIKAIACREGELVQPGTPLVEMEP